MTANDIIQAVKSAGGTLTPEGENLRLRAPVEIPQELKQRIREHKREILEKLCPHAPGCPHSLADLLSEYRETGKLRVQCDGNDVWLIRSHDYLPSGSIGTVYTMTEWTRIAALSKDEIRLLHSLRTIGGDGGSIEIRESE
jgi:hypothetical protein